jgi:hypothetical protein
MSTIKDQIDALTAKRDTLEANIAAGVQKLEDLEAGRNCPPTVPAWLAEKASTSAALAVDRQAFAVVVAELAALEAAHGEAVETARVDGLVTKAQEMAAAGLARIHAGLNAAWEGAEELGGAFDLLQPEAQRHPRLFAIMSKLPGGDLGEKLPPATGFLTKPSAAPNPARKAS